MAGDNERLRGVVGRFIAWRVKSQHVTSWVIDRCSTHNCLATKIDCSFLLDTKDKRILHAVFAYYRRKESALHDASVEVTPKQTLMQGLRALHEGNTVDLCKTIATCMLWHKRTFSGYMHTGIPIWIEKELDLNYTNLTAWFKSGMASVVKLVCG